MRAFAYGPFLACLAAGSVFAVAGELTAGDWPVWGFALSGWAAVGMAVPAAALLVWELAERLLRRRAGAA